MNNQSRTRNPALVSCITSSGTCSERSRLPVDLLRSALGAEHQGRVAAADHVTLRELPSLPRVSVHCGPIRRTEIREHRTLPIPGDLQVPPRDAGVGQSEVGFLAPANHVAALVHCVRPVRTVVQLQRGRELARTVLPRRSIALVVTLVIALAVT